jgi:predicted house-cleaning noncanonical NTP pyrophosphatase (MazG superfamily)
MRKTFRKTFKRNNKAGNRFLERKVHIASMFNGTQRDVTNMILRDYAASRIQKSRRTMVQTMVNKNDFETRVPNFYNNLIRFVIVLRRTNPDPTTVSAIKDDILRTIPDRTVAGVLRLPNLYEQINLLRNLLTNHFPPSNEEEIAELIEVCDSIVGAMNVPLHARITVPLLPYRQHGFVRRQTRTQGDALGDALGQGRKRKTRRAKRRN